jgi:SAM-dependent methyltransferase
MTTISQSHMLCPVCNSSGILPIIRIQNIPLLCNFLYSSAREAQAAEKGDIELVLCKDCTHIYNRAFNPEKIIYQPGYENTLHYSESYQDYARKQVKRLLNGYDLHGQRVVDIGCGKGEFLKLFSSLGNCVGTGFEPAATHDIKDVGKGVRIIGEKFSVTYFDSRTKCYISRHVLEHLSDPGDYLKTIRMAMEDEKAVLFLEVPDGVYMLEQCSVWDAIYEHFSYFTPHSIQYILMKNGFYCQEPLSEFGGQYLFVDALPATGDDTMEFPINDAAQGEVASLAEKFSLGLQNQNRKVTVLLKKQMELGKKVILWGAGSKGIALLNQLPDQGGIQYVVDINPEKQGKFIPGSGQMVVPPEFLTTLRPDIVLIMNSMYQNEIQDCLNGLNVSAVIEKL